MAPIMSSVLVDDPQSVELGERTTIALEGTAMARRHKARSDLIVNARLDDERKKTGSVFMCLKLSLPESSLE